MYFARAFPFDGASSAAGCYAVRRFASRSISCSTRLSRQSFSSDLIYLWLWPAVHFVAMLDARWYRVMNWSMTLDGLMFWWLILDRRRHPPARLAPGVRVLLAVAVTVPQILLGAYITFSHDELYPIYALCGRVFGGISGATDQYLGGLILWIPSSMMSVIAALIAMHRWLVLDSRASTRTVVRAR